MPLLLLAYHRIVHGRPTENPHYLSFGQFRDQMGHLKGNGYPLVSWRNFSNDEDFRAGSVGSVRIGLTFDDGHGSDPESARLLSSLGYDALFFVATEYLGRAGYVDRADLLSMQRLGMGIGSHAHHHVSLTSLSEAEVCEELTRSKQILEDVLQSPVIHLSFPGGAYSARILDIGRRAGYRHFFTSDWGVNHVHRSSVDVFRRSSILNHLDLAQFDALLQLRHYRLRQVGFHAKELAKKALGDRRYPQLRSALIGLRRSSRQK